MSIRVSNLRLPLEEPESALPVHLAKVLRVPVSQLGAWRILRKSLDARIKGEFSFVYTATVDLKDERRVAALTHKRPRGDVRIDEYEQPQFVLPAHGVQPMEHRPVIVGSGPAGLVAGYFLAEQGYQPIVLERGRAVRERIHDVAAFDAGGRFEPESNYLFGEGGAGTFSDGKLTCRLTGPDVRRIL